jgi:Rrf2 family protein
VKEQLDMRTSSEEIGRAGLTWRMVSRTAEYALRAVLYIAGHDGRSPATVGEIATALHVPEKYLGRVLNSLARSGTLRSSRGAHGGFRLARPATRITLADVVAPFDAVGEPMLCLLRGEQCGGSEPCAAHDRWHAVSTHMRGFFQGTTIADLLGEAAA